MKQFTRIAAWIGIISLIGSFGLAVLTFMALAAASVGSRMFMFLEYLKEPYWSIILPAIGILALLPLALRRAFTHETDAGEEESLTETLNWRGFVNNIRRRLYLRPV